MRFIGSKANLIHEIEKMINENVTGNESTFLDLFAGTNVVGNHFRFFVNSGGVKTSLLLLNT